MLCVFRIGLVTGRSTNENGSIDGQWFATSVCADDHNEGLHISVQIVRSEVGRKKLRTIYAREMEPISGQCVCKYRSLKLKILIILQWRIVFQLNVYYKNLCRRVYTKTLSSLKSVLARVSRKHLVGERARLLQSQISEMVVHSNLKYIFVNANPVQLSISLPTDRCRIWSTLHRQGMCSSLVQDFRATSASLHL